MRSFEEKLKSIHGGKIVALEPYVRSTTKLAFKSIVCNHEPWLATPNSVLAGSGCPACGIEKRSKARRLTDEEFQEKLRSAHRGEVIALEPYKGSRTKILFNSTACEHPPWLATPGPVLRGTGCPKCGYETRSKSHG